MLGVNILKEFAFFLLKTSADNGAEENDVLWLNDVFVDVFLDDIKCADANITYDVSGYVGRSISFQHKCSSSKKLLIAGDDFFLIHHYLPDEYKQMFKNVHRERPVTTIRIYLHWDSAGSATLYEYGHSIHYRTDKNQVFIHEQPAICFSPSIN